MEELGPEPCLLDNFVPEKTNSYTRGCAAFQRFASTDAKHYVFCISDTKKSVAYTLELVHKVKLVEFTIYKVSRRK